MAGRELRIPAVVRCMAIQEGPHWIGVSLEFGLAVQGEGEKEVKRKLEEQIADHVQFAQREAATDYEFAAQLLAQRAPAVMYYAWYIAIFQIKLRKWFGAGPRRVPALRKPFRENTFSLMAT